MTISAPLVSFIMPAYNAGAYIEEAVHSVQKQTLTEWELIIVDDGSTDDTFSKAEFLVSKDSRIKVLKMDNPTGSAYQPRKRGIENAISPIIAPLDADDLIEETYLQQLLSLMNQEKADIVYPTMHSFSENEFYWTLPKDSSFFGKPMVGKNLIKYTLSEWQIGCNGGLIKKELYERAFSIFDSSLTYSNADELLTRQLLSIANRVLISSVKYLYRINPLSITHNPSFKQTDRLIVNSKILELIEDKFDKNSEEYLLAQKQNFYGIYDAIRLLNIHHPDKKEKKITNQYLQKCKDRVDYKTLKNNVGLHFLILLKAGIPFVRIALRINDFVRRK